MGGNLIVSKETNLWKNDEGGSVEMTFVEQDRGISWSDAWKNFEQANAAGRPVHFVKSRSAPFGYPNEEKYKSYSLCVGMEKVGLDPAHYFTQLKPHLGATSETLTLSNIRYKHAQVDIESQQVKANLKEKWTGDFIRAGEGCSVTPAEQRHSV